MIFRTPLFNFALGLFFGVLAGAAGAAHICAKRIQEHVEHVNTSMVEIQEHADSIKTSAETIAANSAAMFAAAQLTIARWRERAETCEAQAADRDFRDRWYTMVYEPGSSPADAAPLELLNLARPGLGTFLSKLQQRTAPPGLALRMVLRGYVKPEVMPGGAKFVYTLAPPEIPVPESGVQ